MNISSASSNANSSAYCAIRLTYDPIVLLCPLVMYSFSCMQTLENIPIPTLPFRAEASTYVSLTSGGDFSTAICIAFSLSSSLVTSGFLCHSGLQYGKTFSRLSRWKF